MLRNGKICIWLFHYQLTAAQQKNNQMLITYSSIRCLFPTKFSHAKDINEGERST